MSGSKEHVFLVDNKALTVMPERPMRNGILGKSLEDALQHLLATYPSLLPGSAIDPGSVDPPRFVLLRREMPVGQWSLDHLFVDQTGVLTLVETKLFANPEARREVIGQLIEYAANASAHWGGGLVRQAAAEFHAGNGRELDEVLKTTFGEDLDPDTLWASVEDNLQRGRIRLIIAADELRPEVRRMIEYLNQEMSNAELLGLELKCYGTTDSQLVLVPRIVGQTLAAADRRSGSAGGAVLWDRERLRVGLESIEPGVRREWLTAVLDRALKRGAWRPSRAKDPAFGVNGRWGSGLLWF
jgi:hypothetical protein